MISLLLWIGAALFCGGCGVALAHEKLKGPDRALWMDYVALAVVLIAAIVFVAGCMKMQG